MVNVHIMAAVCMQAVPEPEGAPAQIASLCPWLQPLPAPQTHAAPFTSPQLRAQTVVTLEPMRLGSDGMGSVTTLLPPAGPGTHCGPEEAMLSR